MNSFDAKSVYKTVDLYCDSYGFLAVMKDVLLRACFHGTSKYRSSLFGLFAVF